MHSAGGGVAGELSVDDCFGQAFIRTCASTRALLYVCGIYFCHVLIILERRCGIITLVVVVALKILLLLLLLTLKSAFNISLRWLLV